MVFPPVFFCLRSMVSMYVAWNCYLLPETVTMKVLKRGCIKCGQCQFSNLLSPLRKQWTQHQQKLRLRQPPQYLLLPRPCHYPPPRTHFQAVLIYTRSRLHMSCLSHLPNLSCVQLVSVIGQGEIICQVVTLILLKSYVFGFML